jgi:hypothetical protein
VIVRVNKSPLALLGRMEADVSGLAS